VSGAARTLDFSRPVAVLLIAVLHLIPDLDDPYAVVARLMDAVPPGSYLVMAHAASDIDPEAAAQMATRYNQMSSASVTPRSRDKVAGSSPAWTWFRPAWCRSTSGAWPARSARHRRSGRLLRHRPQALSHRPRSLDHRSSWRGRP
jgi:hypothetical protein